MDISFFFWNIKGKDVIKDKIRIGTHLKKYVDVNKPSIITLAENLFEESDMESIIGSDYQLVAHFKRGVKHVTYISVYADRKGYKIYPASFSISKHIQLNILEVASKKYLIGCVHLASKFKRDLIELHNKAKKYKTYFEDCEFNMKSKFQGSIVYGDFNSNPFEKAMTRHDGWHALNINHEHKSLINQRYFINPTASLVGSFIYEKDETKAPGTHFNVPDQDKENDIHWNMLDGCIYRPSLHKNFLKEEFRIITKIDTNFLFNNDEINQAISDHLPITFKFRF